MNENGTNEQEKPAEVEASALDALVMRPSPAVLKQIGWWVKALRQMNKSIRRKNKHINRLERENDELRTVIADLNQMYVDAMNDKGV